MEEDPGEVVPDGVAVSFVVPGEVVPDELDDMVPELLDPGYVPVPLVLPGTVDPLGEEGAVAAGGCADDPDAPVEELPVCAAQKATSAAWHAPATRMREMNFMVRAPFRRNSAA